MMLDAERPVIYTGGGVVLGEASEQLTELVRMTGFPVTQTLMGLGSFRPAIRCSSACWACTAPTRPTWRCTRRDVLIAIGARFDDRVTGKIAHFCPNARRSSISTSIRHRSPRRCASTYPIVGQVRSVLRHAARAQDQPRKPDAAKLGTWWGAHQRLARMDCLSYEQGSGAIKPQYA